MKIFLLSSVAVLITLAVNGQVKKGELVFPQNSSLKIGKNQDKSPVIMGYQFRTKNTAYDPFVMKPYRDSSSIKAVEIPNGYVKSKDLSVKMPTHTNTMTITPIASIEQLVKPSKK